HRHRPRRQPPRCLHHFVSHSAKNEGIGLGEVLDCVTVYVFVRDHHTMIAAPVQCDVDGIPKGSHYVRVPIAIRQGNQLELDCNLQSISASKIHFAARHCRTSTTTHGKIRVQKSAKKTICHMESSPVAVRSSGSKRRPWNFGYARCAARGYCLTDDTRAALGSGPNRRRWCVAGISRFCRIANPPEHPFSARSRGRIPLTAT